MKKIAFILSGASLAIAGLTFPLASPAAQSGGDLVCMGLAPADVPKLTVIVLQSRQNELEAAGFVAERCNGKEASISNYQAQVCALASNSPPQAKQQFSQAYGVTPDRLCELADELG
ncbi:MAG: hypothetical protein ABJP48_03535 [Erythrobacter sp.]